jgi:hypothetical protein
VRGRGKEGAKRNAPGGSPGAVVEVKRRHRLGREQRRCPYSYYEAHARVKRKVPRPDPSPWPTARRGLHRRGLPPWRLRRGACAPTIRRLSPSEGWRRSRRPAPR